LEQFDPLGRWQTMDAGKPVDATGSFNFVQGKKSFNGAVELAQLIASSDEAHRCYVSHLLEYGYGRVPSARDNPEIKRLAAGSRDGLYSIKELIVELAKSDAFRFRAPVED
jgi:aromatic ring-opening dioxygenase LigB subunit